MRACAYPKTQQQRQALLAAPVLVPVSMAGVFTLLQRLLGPRRGYNAGFGVYWLVWCAAFPLWLMGGKRAVGMLSAGTPPSGMDAAWLSLPVAGAVGAELLPSHRAVTPKVGMTMAAAAVINGVGEELLWRGAYLDAFPDDVWRGAVWPWAGFMLWHLAPQLVLPSPRAERGFSPGQHWSGQPRHASPGGPGSAVDPCSVFLVVVVNGF